MKVDIEIDKKFLERIRNERRALDEQIRLAKVTITQSRELVRALDELLGLPSKEQRGS